MIDLSYLTEKERAQIEAVIDADQELRIQGLRCVSLLLITCLSSSQTVLLSIDLLMDTKK